MKECKGSRSSMQPPTFLAFALRSKRQEEELAAALVAHRAYMCHCMIMFLSLTFLENMGDIVDMKTRTFWKAPRKAASYDMANRKQLRHAK